MPHPAQLEFDNKYITSCEIQRELGVSRTALFYARQTGKLPDPIDVQGQLFIWERDKVRAYLDAWKTLRETQLKDTRS